MLVSGSDWPALLPGVAFDHVKPAAPPRTGTASELARGALATSDFEEFLRAAARARPPLTLVVNDPHRFTDTRSFLDTFFTASPPGGLRMRLLVAAGSHRSTAAERREHERRVLGPWRSRFDGIAWHDARAADLVSLGGFVLHHWMGDGGHYLACGSMEPHYFAGVTGGHKTLTVGVMGMESLAANHRHAMSDAVAGMRLVGNPVHEGIVAAVGALEAAGARLFALNQVIVDGTVVGCSAGHPLAALEAGIPLVRRSFSRRIDDAVDVIVAQVGPPLDRDLYQADKGIKNTEGAVRNGGVLVVEAPCEHGVGLDQFIDLLRAAPTHDAARAVVDERGYQLGDHKAVRLRALTDGRGVRLAVVSRTLEAALGPVLGATILPDRAAAARWIAPLLPRGARGIVVEDAGNLTLETP